MKKLLTISAILLASTTYALESVPAKVTILECGQGRMRSVVNYKVKCAKKTQQLGIARDRTSRILQREAPRYRGSVESSEVPTAKAENMIQKAWRIMREKREAKLLNNTQ